MAYPHKDQLKILLVDDDEEDYILTVDMLDDLRPLFKFSVDWVDNADAAVKALIDNNHDVCLLDYSLGAQNGMDVLKHALKQGSDVPIIALTGFKSVKLDMKLIDAGASDYLHKSEINGQILQRAIWYAVHRKHAEHGRRAAEARVQALRKWESLGILAGGVAHDFNNLLGAISGQTRVLIRKHGKTNRDLREGLQKILEATARSSKITSYMRAITGTTLGQAHDMTLSELISANYSLFAATIPGNITFQTELQSDLPVARIDQRQIELVVSNLIENAVSAIGKQIGVITISTGIKSINETNADDFAYTDGSKTGPHVYIQVTDNGCGMDPQIQTRIFDPFFSKQFVGRGLGLAAVQGVVKAHQGSIWVQSKPGQGATFQILFPRAENSNLSPLPK